MVLALVHPGVVEEIMSREMEGFQISDGLLAFFALFWLIPLAMAFLSVTLKDAANRWTNIVLGAIFTIFNIFHLLGHAIQGQLPLDHLLVGLVTIVVAALVVWYAWGWPKQEARVIG
jgi:hypothetical protein